MTITMDKVDSVEGGKVSNLESSSIGSSRLHQILPQLLQLPVSSTQLSLLTHQLLLKAVLVGCELLPPLVQMLVLLSLSLQPSTPHMSAQFSASADVSSE